MVSLSNKPITTADRIHPGKTQLIRILRIFISHACKLFVSGFLFTIHASDLVRVLYHFPYVIQFLTSTNPPNALHIEEKSSIAPVNQL